MSQMIDRITDILMSDGCGDSDQCEATARRVLAAMLEPTIDMVVAGTEQWLCEAAMEDRAEANYRAMLTAALQEPV